jgi:class 3 adenylate cyclase
MNARRGCFLGFWIFVLLFPLGLWAQQGEWEVKVLGFEEGLSHRRVNRIVQGPDGFLWLGTFNGLDRYDGYEFVPIPLPEHTDESAPVTSLSVDPRSNDLWIGQSNRLVQLEDRSQTWKIFSLQEGELRRGEEQMPLQIFPGPEKEPWLVSQDSKTGSHYLISGEDLQKRKRLPLGKDQPSVSFHQGQWWIGGVKGEVWNWDGEERDFSLAFTLPLKTPADVTHIEPGHSDDWLILLEDGQIWQGKKGGPWVRLEVSDQLVSENQFYALLAEPNGDLWVAGENSLFYYQAASGQMLDLNEEVREVVRHRPTYRQLLKDHSGVIWVASDYGAIRINRTRKLFKTHLNGGNEYCSSGFCSMRGIAESDDSTLFFSYYNSIHQYDPENGQLDPLFPKGEFMFAPFGMVWYQGQLLTGNGFRIDLSTLDVDTLFQQNPGDQGVTLIDQTGTPWLACQKQLFRYATDQETWDPYVDAGGLLDSFPSDFTWIHQGQQSGYLWMGTIDRGLYRLDLKTDSLVPYPLDTKLRPRLGSDRILVIYEAENGTLWVGTAAGLNRISADGRQVDLFREEEGMPNNFINGLLPEGDSCLWISTDNGLARISIEDWEVSRFFEADGLPANEFNRSSFFRSSSGRLYFGGLNGVTEIEPGPRFSLLDQEARYPLVWTYFSKFDGKEETVIRELQLTEKEKGVRLSYLDKFFTFGFALTDFVNSKEHRYSFRLMGYDEEWSPPSPLNYARYHNLPAGKYTLEVRAGRGPADWHSEPLTIPVFVEEAYYRTPWFIGLCILLVSGLLIGVVQYRIYLLKKREHYLEEQVKARTRELEEEKEKSENLLLNILPAELATELKKNGKAKARRHDRVTVMFTDFKSFTRISERLEPEELVAEIDECFRGFDRIMERHGLEKIKTIGDAYLCVGGLPGNDPQSAARVVEAALDIQVFMEDLAETRRAEGNPYFETRIGIHTGPVVAGIVGIKKFAYDIWGDTVNIASHLETEGEVGKVNISRSTYNLVKDRFSCIYRGKIVAKNKGAIDMYFVERLPSNSAQSK